MILAAFCPTSNQKPFLCILDLALLCEESTNRKGFQFVCKSQYFFLRSNVCGNKRIFNWMGASQAGSNCLNRS